jgi:hypothetical protein
MLMQPPDGVTIVNEASDSSWAHDVFTTAIPALIAVVVVVLGGLIQWRLARHQIEAARVVADEQLKAADRRWIEEQDFERAKLIRQDRATVYVEVLALASRLVRIMERTHPMMTPAPEPPAFPEEPELELIYARLDAFGSSNVRDHLLPLFAVMREFQYEAMRMTQLRSNPATEHSDEAVEMWRTLHNLRSQTGDLVDALRVAVSTELHDGK